MVANLRAAGRSEVCPSSVIRRVSCPRFGKRVGVIPAPEVGGARRYHTKARATRGLLSRRRREPLLDPLVRGRRWPIALGATWACLRRSGCSMRMRL